MTQPPAPPAVPPSILPPNTHRAAVGSATSAVFVTPDEKEAGIDPLAVAQKVAAAAVGPNVAHGHLGQRGISVQMVGGQHGPQALHVQHATATQLGDPAAASPGQVMPLLKPARASAAAMGEPPGLRVVDPTVASPLQGLQAVRLFGNDAMLCCQLMQSYSSLRELRPDGSVVLFDPYKSPMPLSPQALFAEVPALIVERLIDQGLLSADVLTVPTDAATELAPPASHVEATAAPTPLPLFRPGASSRVPARMTRDDKGQVVRPSAEEAEQALRAATAADVLDATGVTAAIELTRDALAPRLAEPPTPEPEKQVAPLEGGGGGETAHENVVHNPTVATRSFAAPAGPPLQVHIRGSVQIYSPSHVKVSHERDPDTDTDVVTVEPVE